MAILSLLLSGNSTAIAQGTKQALTLEGIFKDGTYNEKGFGPVRWMNDNLAYSTLEPNTEYKGKDIVRYEAATGKRSVVIPANLLIPKGDKRPLGIADYSWSADNQQLLLFTNTRKVWRYHTRGDYWVLNIKTGELVQIGKSVEAATSMFAKFSPDGTRIAFVSKQNIYVETPGSGISTPVTKDGGGDIINGTFDWVYEEELDCRDGFRWSPDSKNIAFWQSDTKGVGTFYLIDNVDSLYSRPIPMPYPKVGTTLSAVKVGVVSADGGEARWFNIEGDPRNNYLARMDFIPNSSEVMIQQLNRLQNTNKVWVGNTATMQLTNIITEKDAAFLDVYDNIKWMDGEKYFTWTSERDGWLHLYKVSRNGKEVKLITKGDFDVVNINCIDLKGGYVYYIASPGNFTERYLYRSRINGTGEAERISPSAMPGQHSYNISDDARYAVHVFQNVTTPPVISIISLPGHKSLRVMEDNKALKNKVDLLGLRPKEFLKIDIGDVKLDAWMIKPADFDPNKKYPILFYVYGEPAAATVQNNWGGGDLWHQYMAQKGYIVMSVDNRGTKTPRGRDWRKIIYRQIGILAAEDQSKAAKKIFSMFRFIDTAKVGIWGWSGGGQMTLNCMFRYPEIYKTGMALAFVSDQRLYDATYQERYMGLPDDNAEGYKNGSPITHAAGLKGKLMVIHGTADDNVHYQSFERLVNELIKQNKVFNMMSYPMRSHSINERENTSLHLRRTMEKFWEDNL